MEARRVTNRTSRSPRTTTSTRAPPPPHPSHAFHLPALPSPRYVPGPPPGAVSPLNVPPSEYAAGGYHPQVHPPVHFGGHGFPPHHALPHEFAAVPHDFAGRRLGVGRGRGRVDAVAVPLPPRLAPPVAPQGLPAPPGHASPDFGFHEPSGAASPFGPPPPHHFPAYPVAPAAAYHRHAATYPLGTPSHGTPSQEWTPSQKYRGRPHRRHGRGCASPPSTSPARLPPGGALHDQ